MTFTLDRYEPVAFHAYPALMRPAATHVSDPEVARTTPGSDKPVPAPVAAYLVGIDATAVLRHQLADFLDAAGTRQDVRVSVGVSGESTVEWVLRDALPYGVRALPRYPATEPVVDPAAAVAAAASAVAADAADQPDRRLLLLVLVWGRQPAAVRFPGLPASTLVLHCVDAELDRLPPDGWGSCWLLARSRHRPRRSVLAQAGQLLTGWEAFREVPDGLVLARLG
ncbi:MAG TPA: hypothetical protein VGW74_00425 [Propionibacteriaceae bacterium]|nr:hypothetical protein [Propionibacteriaceae bacterium]